MSKTIEETVADYIQNSLLEDGAAPITNETSLIALGVLDSIAVAAVLAFTESEFGIIIEESEIALENVESVNAIAALVRHKVANGAVSAHQGRFA
jgi:acyl carrier protein